MSAHPAELRTLHLAMLDAVLVGEGLGTVADLAAAECGGPVVLIVPRLEVLAPSADVRRRAISPSCAATCSSAAAAASHRCRPGSPPRSRSPPAPSCSARSCCSATHRPGERALERLRLVSVAALTEIALAHARDVPDEGASATLLSALAGGAELGREEIVRRAARGGCDLRGGAVAVVCELHVERPRHVVALVRDDWPGALAQHVTDGAGVAPPRLVALLPLRTARSGRRRGRGGAGPAARASRAGRADRRRARTPPSSAPPSSRPGSRSTSPPRSAPSRTPTAGACASTTR